jgi:hypothetical protein
MGDITNTTLTKVKTMTKKFLTAKETEGMTLEQFQAAMREGKIEIRKSEPTWETVTMNGKYSCD